MQRVEGVGGDAAEQRSGLVGAPHPGRRARPGAAPAGRTGAGAAGDGARARWGASGRRRGRRSRRRDRRTSAASARRRVRGRRRSRRSNATAARPRRCRAGGRSRSRATASAGRAAPGRASTGTASPTPIGMERRAVVVDHAGHGELAAAGAAADVVGGFEHFDVDPVLGEAHGGGEAVGPRADDDGGGHHRTPTATSAGSMAAVATVEVVMMDVATSTRSSSAGRIQVTCSAIGPLGSHGSSATESATW